MIIPFINKVINPLGYQFAKMNFQTNELCQLLKIMQTLNVNVLFDVGANKGQFAENIRKLGYQQKIISFEPVNDAYNILLKKSAKDKNWIVENRCAIGANDGNIEINVSENLECSSILNMNKTHENIAPKSVYIKKENVPIYKLDTILPKYFEDHTSSFLKIDTQGYEESVINGSLQILKNISGIYMELSLVELYANEMLFDNMLKKMYELNFKLISIWPSLFDKVSGNTIQVNATFLQK